MDRFNVIGLIEILFGVLLLWVSSGATTPRSNLTNQARQRRATRQAILSICALALVMLGVATQRFTSSARAESPCEQHGPGSPAAAGQCLHGTLRLLRGR
jgi:hypothetical protein